jgi:3-oxoadipate enol-lactonase
MPTITVSGKNVDYDQTGSGKDLLLLHTLLADASVYDEILPAVAAQRRVTRLSFPGFGASDRGCATIEAFADWTAAAMDALELPTDTDVFANGFGGFVAVGLALRHGDRFGRLVLADTGAAFPEPAKVPLRTMAEKVETDGIEAILDTAIGRMFPPEYAAAAPDVVATRKARLRTVDPAAFADACRALAALDHRPRLGEIDKPVLVVVGLADQTTPPAMSRELADGIPGARYEEMPGVGHCPQLQDQKLLLSKIAPFFSLAA